ncbi:hypothetical protein E2562_002338 [Oryza meyeriana var. granulata]|uniref:Uncharacterized protein n=1 Tax=Oryza meyeriana var. granulata TaxID=110450 RepID=A0A6G1BIK8_9ORYZ|nr:hypothetical protein E2562_002338 [Oryza meyeriana var. granulata]
MQHRTEEEEHHRRRGLTSTNAISSLWRWARSIYRLRHHLCRFLGRDLAAPEPPCHPRAATPLAGLTLISTVGDEGSPKLMGEAGRRAVDPPPPLLAGGAARRGSSLPLLTGD